MKLECFYLKGMPFGVILPTKKKQTYDQELDFLMYPSEHRLENTIFHTRFPQIMD